MSSLLISNRSYDSELCHLDKMPQNDNSHLVEFQRLLEAGDFEGALEQAKAFLLNLSPIEGQEQLSKLCDALENFLPNLSTEEKERLLLRFIEKIKEFPDLNLEKARALTWYGELFLTKGSEYSNLCASMRSLATGYVQDPTQERAQKLFDPILPIVYKNFEKQLCRLAGTGEVAAFQQLVETFCSRFAYGEDISMRFYQIAYSVYRGLNEKNQKAFTPLLTQLQQGTRGELPFVKAVPPTTVYKEKLQAVRSRFTDEEETRLFQKNRAKEFREFYAYLFEEALFIFGPPPCKYDIRAMGSLAREEVCPYSDIEYFIQIEDETHRENFQEIAKIFHLQILSLGETDSKHQGSLNFGQKCGLEIDNQADPATNSLFIGTAEVLFHPSSEQTHNAYKSYKSRFRSVSILGNHMFKVPRLRDLFFLEKLLLMRREAFATLNPLQGGECKLKDEFMGPLYHYLGELGLYYGLEETNTLDLIDKLPCFTDLSRVLLKEAVSAIYRMRIRIQLQNEGLLEDAALPPSLSPVVLTTEEKNTLEKIHCLILVPLYDLGLQKLVERTSDGRELNLIEIAWGKLSETRATELGPLVKQTASFLERQGGTFKDHKQNYLRLATSTSFECLQEKYLEGLECIPGTAVTVRTLANLPNIAGFRQQTRRDEYDLIKKIESLMTTNLASGVKVDSPFLKGHCYLKLEVKQQLLGKNGHLKPHEDYRGRSQHAVTRLELPRFPLLHFKESSYQPMMEYAAFSFTRRVMGEATPPSSLVRFKIGDLSYPVLVTKTIEGKNLRETTPADAESLDQVQLTWFKLCEILLKIADGRPSNYVLKDGLIFGVDNDIAFCNPLQRGFLQSLRVRFGSSLFLLGREVLDRRVLEEFCSLDPKSILLNWLNDIEAREKMYSHFFLEKEKELYYTQDEEMRFVPKFLVPKGAVTSLWMQFCTLQSFLKDRLTGSAPVLSLDLFDAFVTLDHKGYARKQLGSTLKQRYQSAIQKEHSLSGRYQAVTSAPMSMTSLQAQKACFGHELTYQETQKKVFSIEEVKQELSFLQISEEWIQVGDVRDFSKDVVAADFGSVQDSQRQRKILNALEIFLDHCEEKPTVLILRNCGVLDHTALSRILRKVNSQRLRELNLEGCPRITNFYGSFPQLESLNLARCQNLTTMQITSNVLTKLNISDCISLTKVTLNIDPEIIDIQWDNTPNFDKGELHEQWFSRQEFFSVTGFIVESIYQAVTREKQLATHRLLLGEKYMLGDGVPLDSTKAEEIFNQEVARKNMIAYLYLAKFFFDKKGNANLERMIELCKKMGDYSDAQMMLGLCYFYGEGITKDRKLAVDIFKKIVEKEHPAKLILAYCYYHGIEVSKDEEKAISYWNDLAYFPASSIALACIHFLKTRNAKKFSQSLRKWEEVVLKENITLMYVLAKPSRSCESPEAEIKMAYKLWTSFSRNETLLYPEKCYTEIDDIRREVCLWEEGAIQNDPVSKCALGICYHYGEGVQRDLKRAIELFQSSAAMGHPYAKKMIGRYYAVGEGLPLDENEGYNLFIEAAEGGDPEAQFIVGWHLFHGKNKDVQKAISLWESSAALGDPIARCVLGQRYYLGEGVEVNHERAIELWNQT